MSTTMNFPTVSLAELALKALHPHSISSRPVILVVDDEAIIADTLAIILSRNGFAPMVAYNGASALAIADLVPPDLLLSDVMMPGMNGVDLAVTIRQLVPTCKILLFSGQAATANLLAEADEAGQDFDILSKPIHPNDLLARVSKALELPGFPATGTSTERSPAFAY